MMSTQKDYYETEWRLIWKLCLNFYAFESYKFCFCELSKNIKAFLPALCCFLC